MPLIYGYFEKNNLLTTHQYGFLKHSSTNLAIYDIVENMISNKDKGNYSGAIFVDLKKTFDTVDHIILMKKLEHYGIRGFSLEFIKSYLENPAQYSIISGKNPML